MVVLRGDEDVAVEGVDERGPALGVLVLVLARARRVSLVEDREALVGQVDELDFEVVAVARLFEHP